MDRRLRLAKRKAEQGEPEEYLNILRRIDRDKFFTESVRLLTIDNFNRINKDKFFKGIKKIADHNNYADYVELLITAELLDPSRREDAIKIMHTQPFQEMFEPTAQDMLREDHEEKCHAEDYPGHCCLQNLKEEQNVYNETEIMCAECDNILASTGEDGGIWISGDEPTCSEEPDGFGYGDYEY